MLPGLSSAMLMGGAGGAAPDVSKVFATKGYIGNGATQTIVNGIDLSGARGLVWTKVRNQPFDHFLIDGLRGVGAGALKTSSSDAQQGLEYGLTAFNNNGYFLGSNAGGLNGNLNNYVSWSFVDEDRFFKVVTFTHTNGADTSIDLSGLGNVGLVTIKRLDTNSDWATWVRGLAYGFNLKLNTTDARYSSGANLVMIGNVATFLASAPSGNYILYAWAHDPDPDGVIQAFDVTCSGSGNDPIITGWPVQFIILKYISRVGPWYIVDRVRTPAWSGSEAVLQANSSAAELSGDIVSNRSDGVNLLGFTATGDRVCGIAIRAPA
ncbi:hypothetical protein [Devosia sp. 63-57]|uniref:DUF7483 domain-containing protein n=1 Tax=Devosia sp. 63-57 TaxID=1895751 RepID=UPI000AC3607D|nr:hypothetical protein [Devosia sp. 63-57]